MLISSNRIKLIAVIFVTIVLFMGCSDPEKKKVEHFKKGMEYVEKEDMVLILASGAGETSKIKGRGFKIKIGENPAFNPLNASYRGSVNYGYFMASLPGKLKLSYKYVKNAS